MRSLPHSSTPTTRSGWSCMGSDLPGPIEKSVIEQLVAFTTNFYERPLVIQGAGAGGDVTATGVLADVLRCVNQPKGSL